MGKDTGISLYLNKTNFDAEVLQCVNYSSHHLQLRCLNSRGRSLHTAQG